MHFKVYTIVTIAYSFILAISIAPLQVHTTQRRRS